MLDGHRTCNLTRLLHYPHLDITTTVYITSPTLAEPQKEKLNFSQLTLNPGNLLNMRCFYGGGVVEPVTRRTVCPCQIYM